MGAGVATAGVLFWRDPPGPHAPRLPGSPVTMARGHGWRSSVGGIVGVLSAFCQNPVNPACLRCVRVLAASRLAGSSRPGSASETAAFARFRFPGVARVGRAVGDGLVGRRLYSAPASALVAREEIVERLGGASVVGSPSGSWALARWRSSYHFFRFIVGSLRPRSWPFYRLPWGGPVVLCSDTWTRRQQDG